MSQLFRDRPQTAMDTAIFWTEYVIRHRGAAHLRSAAVDLPWYQYLLLDVQIFLMLIAVTCSFILYLAFKKLGTVLFLSIARKQGIKTSKLFKSQ
jgi:glucuronosyltransferase